jgi:hypothetical protein
VLSILGAPAASHAITITVDTSAPSLAAAVTTAGGGTGIVVTGSTLSRPTATAPSSGTYTNATGTYGIPPGVVLSSGDVSNYADGPNTAPEFTTDYGAAASPAQEALLDPITGGFFSHFDVTQLDITFDMLSGFDTVFFLAVFGSEEFDEFVGSSFIDGFGLYVNGVNIATVGGSPVNINHPDMAFLPGTELDGILAPGGNTAVLYSSFVGDGSTGNTLTFIVADTSDPILDTTVYIAALAGVPIPEPSSLALVAVGIAAMAATRSPSRRSPSSHRVC